MRSFHFRSHHILPFFIALAAACGGQSCSCVAPIPGGFPAGKDNRHPNAIQVRVTQPAIDYLEQNGAGLVSKVLPGGSTKFDVPSSCGDPKICCNQKCAIDIGVQSLNLDTVPPSTLSFIVNTKLKTLNPLELSAGVLLGSTCLVTLDTERGKLNKSVDLQGSLAFQVDPQTALTSLVLGDVQLNKLEADMIVTARCDGKLVGVSRALTDFQFCTYLSDLAVDEAVQGQGIGKRLIEETHLAAGKHTMLILIAAPKAASYYPHIGMEAHPSCWVIPRKAE